MGDINIQPKSKCEAEDNQDTSDTTKAKKNQEIASFTRNYVLDHALEKFDELDQNNNRKLERSELKSAADDITQHYYDRAKATMLRQNFNVLKGMVDDGDGISRDDLKELSGKPVLPQIDRDATEDPSTKLEPKVWNAVSHIAAEIFKTTDNLMAYEALVIKDSKLPDLSNITTLTIDDRDLTADDVERICQASQLKKLVLSDVALKEELDTNSKIRDNLKAIISRLESLHLHKSSEKHYGEFSSIFNELKELPNLRELVLESADNSYGLGNLKKAVNLEKLAILGPYTYNSTLKHVAELTDLRSLSLEGSSVSDNGLSELRKLKELTELNLSGMRINGNGLNHLQELPIRRLDLSNTALDEEKLMQLADFKALRELTLHHNQYEGPDVPDITQRTIDHLLKIPCLEQVKLRFMESKINIEPLEKKGIAVQ